MRSMPKKILRRDTEIRNYGHTNGVFPNYDIPEPEHMEVKPYRSRDMKKTYGSDGGDRRVVIKKTHPRPTILKWQEKNMNNTINDLRKRLTIS